METKTSATRISLLLFLWNPITLSILLKSIPWGVSISLVVVMLGLLIGQAKSLRLKVWAFNIAALLSIAYHAELLFTHFGGEKNIPNLYDIHNKYYFNKPYLEQKFTTDEYVSLYRTNCQGYRIDRLTDTEDCVTSCDWLFIGDSFTQGAQVNYDQLFTSLIYKYFPNKIIVNAGISGAGLYEELNYYKELGRKLHPQKVFLQIGVFNDFKDVTEHKATFQDYLAEKSSLYRYLTYQLGQNNEKPFGRWMEPFFINLQDNIDNNILYKPSSQKKEKDKQNFRKCIAQFKEAIEADGAELILILLPSKEQISSTMLKETLSACNLKESDIDIMAANRLCKDVAQQEGLKLIDLYSDFKNTDFPFFLIDEHLSISGHEIIANRIVSEYSRETIPYQYFSLTNRNERYPSLLSDSISVLYQSQDSEGYSICIDNKNDHASKILLSSAKELIHPSISPSMGYMVFTIGNQEKHQTEVVLYNFEQNKQVTINDKGCSAAIPMFNANGTQIAYPQWNQKDMSTYITVYDIASAKNIYSFIDGVECWRPIFSKDGSKIFYICREREDGKFIIKSNSIHDKKSTIVFKADYDIWDIALSPSGNHLAFSGNKDKNWDLFMINLTNRQVKQITHTLGNEWDPSFGPTDNDLWFAGDFGFNNGIYHLTID